MHEIRLMMSDKAFRHIKTLLTLGVMCDEPRLASEPLMKIIQAVDRRDDTLTLRLKGE